MKRIIDICISFSMLVIVTPIFMFVIIVSKIRLGSPVFFKQLRPGLHGKPFYLYKLRTMLDMKDRYGNVLPDEQRITTFGQFLRKYSIDEFPQLLNVLKGDMSLVGPRPLLMEYLPLYTEEQRIRHHVRPGMTGWAQVNGRNAITWEEKFKLDTWYVKNQSLSLDIKIIMLTVLKVLRKEGIHQAGHVTIDKFQGSKEVGL